MLIDTILGASFGTLMVFLIKGYKCKPGDLSGWYVIKYLIHIVISIKSQ